MPTVPHKMEHTAEPDKCGVKLVYPAPNNGGLNITEYRIEVASDIFKNNGEAIFFSENLGCNTTALTCTIPMDVLNKEPYSLPIGARINSRVSARNVIGWSIPSTGDDGPKVFTTPS